MKNIDIVTRKVPHNGDVTAHQDQSIYPISFNAMNTIVIRPKNPIPPDAVVVVLLLISILLHKNFIIL